MERGPFNFQFVVVNQIAAILTGYTTKTLLAVIPSTISKIF